MGYEAARTLGGPTMQRFSTFALTELKLVYRVLQQNLLDHPDLMDSEFLETLQRWLQYRAGEDGVDVTDHAQWILWLDTATPPTATAHHQRVIPLSLSGASND